MLLSRDNIAGKIIQNLEDESNVHYTLEDTYDSIHDGYEHVALFAQCIEKIVSIDIVANQTYYNLRELIPDYYRIFAIWNTTNNRWLTPRAFVELKENGSMWETVHGTPIEFAPLGCDWMAIYRKPTETTIDGFVVLYKATPTEMTGNELPSFDPAHHEILVEYGTGDLLDQNLEYTKSQRFMALFSERLIRLKVDNDRRSMPDRIMGLVSLEGEPAAK